MKKKLLYFLMLLGFAGLTNVNAKEIAADDIEPRTYIIGTHEFTESTTLSTKHIMLASKTIDGNTLNDMIIYYKNPRGKWINGLTGEIVEVSEKFNIEYVDLVKFLTAPTLANDYNDKTKANLSILGAGYYGSSEETLKEISGWELYEKTTDGYSKITEGTNYNYKVTLNPGETKTFVARVYKLNETLDRVYSDYSNEVEVTRETLNTPTLANDYNDKTKASLSILGAGYYGSSEETLKEISGWELYEKTENGYSKITEGTNYTYQMELVPGETKTFVARVYYETTDGNRIYSEYSDELEVTREKLQTPTLARDFHYTNLAKLAITADGYYAGNENTEEISGWELYEKVGENYNKIKEGTEYFYTSNEFAPGETKVYVSRVYYETTDGNRIYSDYSNEIEVTREKLQTPTLARDFHYTNLANIAITAEGYYAKDKEVLKEISGWELYEKVGENYNKIKEGTEYFYTSNEFAPGETKVYVSRVYYETTDGNRIYSDYSNELEVTREKLQTPTLANDPSDLSGAHLSMAVEGYYASGEEALKEITGWELYEKTDSGYVLVTNDSTYSHNVSMDQGTTKTFIARVYYENENVAKTYSDYSNEVVVTIEKIKVPTLSYTADSQTAATLSIINEGTYKDETEQNKITGWELYEVGETNTLITDEKPYTYTVNAQVGETKTYIARIYMIDVYENKVYSDYSSETKVEFNEIKTPVLSIASKEKDKVTFTIAEEGYYSYSGNIDGISSWSLRDATDGTYSLIKDITDSTYSIEIPYGEAKKYVASVSYQKDNKIVKSNYSNIILIDEKLPVPTLTNSQNYNQGAKLSIQKEGNYSSDLTRVDSIASGYQIYEQTEQGYTLVYEGKKYLDYRLAIDPGNTKRYTARLYKELSTGDKTYSDYSNVVEVTTEAQTSSFFTDDWATIVNTIKAGNTNNYQVGDIKRIDLGEYGTHTIRVANTSTPTECSNSSFSQTACGFVLEFVDIITKSKMIDGDTTSDGWPSTRLRTLINEDIFNSLPNDLQNGIIDTKVISSYKTGTYTSTDKLYLLTPIEIYTNWEDQNDNTYGKTRQLDYYAKTMPKKYTEHFNSASKVYGNFEDIWWTRIGESSDEIRYGAIYSSGTYGVTRSNLNYGVSPAFRIG